MTLQDHQNTGLNRSISLLRALGPKAAPVWAALDPSDAAKLTKAMEKTPPHHPHQGEAAANALLDEVGKTHHHSSAVWAELSSLRPDQLNGLLEKEHPQVVALTLTRISSPAAAAYIRYLPPHVATDILQRMLNMAPAHTAALGAIETRFSAQAVVLGQHQKSQPDATVARLFDALPADTSETLLSALHHVEPKAGERIRALMFTFPDLAALSRAGMQTLLSRTPRETLTLALKGAPGGVADVIFANMTQRAGDLLREEITAIGPKPRKDVEAARTAMVTLARNLIDSGDIRSAEDTLEEDLIA